MSSIVILNASWWGHHKSQGALFTNPLNKSRVWKTLFNLTQVPKHLQPPTWHDHLNENHIDNEHKAIDAKYTLYDKIENEAFGLGYEKSKKHKRTTPFGIKF